MCLIQLTGRESEPGESAVRAAPYSKDMFHKLPISHLSTPRFVFIVAILVAILAFTACSSSTETQNSGDKSSDGLELVWESWDQISARYVSAEPLDADSVVSGAMRRVLDLIEVAPYQIGRAHV